MSTPLPLPPVGEILRRKGIHLQKGKSQHFLKQQSACMAIAEAACLTPNHVAIEVGAGLGNLSAELAVRAGRVLSVELDRVFEDWHGYLTANYPALSFLYEDFLEVDLEATVASLVTPGQPVVGVGNLPYKITSEILFRFVDSPTRFESLVFMIQREVAERIAAGPATRASGALTYKIALGFDVEILFVLPPEDFLPPPKVHSSVIRLRPLASPLVTDPAQRKRVYRLLDGVFSYRRKTLGNALAMAGLAPDRASAEVALRAADIDPIRRCETLQLDEVVRLTEGLRPRA